MGYSLGWTAVEASHRIQALHVLALRESGTRTDRHDRRRIVGTVLPSGWYIIVGGAASDAEIKKLSSGGRVVAFQVVDSVMFSKACLWQDGQCVWSVEHESERGIMDLRTSGQLPTVFTSIHDRRKGEQTAAGGTEADVDFIHEVPADLAQVMVGYRHDDDDVIADRAEYELLESTRRPWWKFWARG